MGSTIVGVDIGSRSVRAVEVRGAAGDKPVITRYHEVAVPEGSVHRGEVLEVATVAEALKQLWSSGGFSSKDVVLGMGGQRVIARDLAVPRAPIAQIRESLPFQVQDLLPVPVEDAILDFYPISEETGEDGPHIDGLLVAAIKEAVAANVDAATRAGLRPIHVDLIPFALTRALSPISDSTALAVLIGVGADTTNIIISRGGVPLFVRILAAGGDDITRQLATTQQIELADAEAFKRQFGLASSNVPVEQRPGIEVIYAVVGDLFTSIRNTLAYFASTKRAGRIEQVIVTGGGTQLLGFTDALAEMTGLPVSSAFEHGAPAMSKKLASSVSALQVDSLSTAYGLAVGTRS